MSILNLSKAVLMASTKNSQKASETRKLVDQVLHPERVCSVKVITEKPSANGPLTF